MHLRRGAARHLLPVGLVVTIAVILLRDRFWIGDWPETGAAAQIPATLVGGLAAGASAWSATAFVRHDLVEQLLAARTPPWRRELLACASSLFGVSLAILVGAFLAGGLTARTWPPGFQIAIGYLLIALLQVLLAVALGHLVGKLMPGSGGYAAVISGLTWIVLSQNLGGSIALSVVSGPVHQDVRLDVMALRLLAGAGVLAFVILLPSRVASLGTQTSWKPVLVAGIGAVAALALVVGAGSPLGWRVAPDSPLCRGTRMRLCLWPEHAKYEGMVGAIADRADRLPAAFELPPQIDELGLSYQIGGTGQVVDLSQEHVPFFTILNGSVWSISGVVAQQIVNRTLMFCDGELTKGTESKLLAIEIEAWLEAYLADGSVPDYATNRSNEESAAATRGHERTRLETTHEQVSWAVDKIAKYNRAPCR